MPGRAGRILIVGGHKSEFHQIQAIFEGALAAGAGEVKAAVPDSLQRLLGPTFPGIYLPASQSGSLGKSALGELLRATEDVDTVVIGANLSNNAETAVLIESLIRKIETPVVIASEAIEILGFHPELITGNPNCLVAGNFATIFSLAGHHHLPITIKPGGGVMAKVEVLRQLSQISRCSYLAFDHEVLVQAGDQVGLTPLETDANSVSGQAIGLAATFWTQNRSKPWEGLMASSWLLKQALVKPSDKSIAVRIRAVLSNFDQH